MTGFISSYVEGCDKCQCYRKDIHPKVLIHPQEVPEGLWQVIGVDLIGPLPMSKGKDAILNIVDHYTKQLHLFPVATQITADGVASIYFDYVFPLARYTSKDHQRSRSPVCCQKYESPPKAARNRRGPHHSLPSAG
jgi:hypothetical protein